MKTQTENSQEIIDFDHLFKNGNQKVNKRVKLTQEDAASGMKIFCNEPYAQELYNKLFSSDTLGRFSSKDLEPGDVRKVVAKRVDFTNKVIETHDILSHSTIYVPFREFSEEPSLLAHSEIDSNFQVLMYSADNGDLFGSEKRCSAITYREDLEEFMKTDKWFYVKVVNLVKGGYLALYKGKIKCFLPGSHAAANVIRDFNEFLNKEIPVMIENFDSANDLFIVSYKKYIKQTLPQRVLELKVGDKYTGILTNDPYDFGMFIEFQNYFTGLIHKTEFQDYAAFAKDYKSGDSIDFYIKEITIKKGEPRIILTDSYEKIDQNVLAWHDLKESIEGKVFDYTLDKRDFFIEIDLPDYEEPFRTDVNHLKGRLRIENSGQVKITRVDAAKQQLKFEFI